MSNPTRQILLDIIRHGEPEGGDILRGRVDPRLTERGWQQMRHATGLLNSVNNNDVRDIHPDAPCWDTVITSPLQRCSAFAEEVASSLGLLDALRVEEQWAEIDYGDWDGMPLDEWRTLAKEQFKAFRKDLNALRPPNGEAYVDFRDRVLGAWEELAQLPDGSHALLVTHGGVMRVLLPTVLGMPLNASFPLHIPFAAISRVRLQTRNNKTSATLLFHNGAEYPFAQRD